jgi:exodeoxyribonuclease VII small subunit
MPAKAKTAAEPTTKISFEDAVEKLESIVEEMESDNLPLEKMLVRYEEGAQLVKVCEEKLQSAETRITQLEEKLEGELSTRPVTLREDEE